MPVPANQRRRTFSGFFAVVFLIGIVAIYFGMTEAMDPLLSAAVKCLSGVPVRLTGVKVESFHHVRFKKAFFSDRHLKLWLESGEGEFRLDLAGLTFSGAEVSLSKVDVLPPVLSRKLRVESALLKIRKNGPEVAFELTLFRRSLPFMRASWYTTAS